MSTWVVEVAPWVSFGNSSESSLCLYSFCYVCHYLVWEPLDLFLCGRKHCQRFEVFWLSGIQYKQSCSWGMWYFSVKPTRGFTAPSSVVFENIPGKETCTGSMRGSPEVHGPASPAGAFPMQVPPYCLGGWGGPTERWKRGQAGAPLRSDVTTLEWVICWSV